jgi:hypothetical protein
MKRVFIDNPATMTQSIPAPIVAAQGILDIYVWLATRRMREAHDGEIGIWNTLKMSIFQNS